MPVLLHGVHYPGDGDWREERKKRCIFVLYCLKHDSFTCMRLKQQSARGRQASISPVSKVLYLQHNFCFEPAVQVMEPGQYLLLFSHLFTSCKFHIKQKCHQKQCFVLIIGKRQPCTEFFSVSGHRQEPEAASIPVN